jgi:hypothetical protein
MLLVSLTKLVKCEIWTETLVVLPRLLIPLNVCRKGTLYMPWECENERHAYEKCVYTNYLVGWLASDFPSAQMPVRRVSLNGASNSHRTTTHNFL